MAETRDVTGVILAGGRSARLGRNKALELIEGEALITRVANRLGRFCQDLVVVVAEVPTPMAPLVPHGTEVVVDAYPSKGSLGGIYTGLATAPCRWAFVVACDMPFLNVDLMRYMVACRSASDVVVPIVNDRPEPTHALYSKACLLPIRTRLERNELKITGFFKEVRVTPVFEADIVRFSPGLNTFFNVNTQEDLDTAQRLAREGN